MISLTVLIWISLTSAVLHVRASGRPAESWIHLSVQLLVLLAVIIEAGSLESGRGSRWRRPTQAMALLAYVAHMVLSHPELCVLSSG